MRNVLLQLVPALLLVSSLLTPAAWAQAPAAQGTLTLTAGPPATPDEIGRIDFFGYAGLPVERIRAALPLHPGDHLLEADFERVRAAVNASVLEISGHPLTDMNVVCCDEGKLLVYVGLAGQSSRPVPTLPTPTGTQHLSRKALALYADNEAALLHAVTSGNAGEDDSAGYSLSVDPAARAVQLRIRTYALAHTPELRRVLQRSADRKQREAAALLLGYAHRSGSQMAALVQAMSDGNSEVRNNATRSLAVHSVATGSEAIAIPARPYIDLLFSPKWTDRNKVSFLLARRPDKASPQLFRTLRAETLEPLIEGASWSSPGHSAAFLAILVRIERLDGAPGDSTPANPEVVLERARALRP